MNEQNVADAITRAIKDASTRYDGSAKWLELKARVETIAEALEYQFKNKK